MNVLVDTSVWVDFFNGYPSAEAQRLAKLIEDEDEVLTCGVVVAELFQGFRQPPGERAAGDKGAELMASYFRDMVWLTPQEPDTYFRAADLFRRLRRKGITIRSTIDCLIAVLAETSGAFLLAKDRDMRHILRSGLCKVQPVP